EAVLAAAGAAVRQRRHGHETPREGRSTHGWIARCSLRALAVSMPTGARTPRVTVAQRCCGKSPRFRRKTALASWVREGPLQPPRDQGRSLGGHRADGERRSVLRALPDPGQGLSRARLRLGVSGVRYRPCATIDTPAPCKRRRSGFDLAC